MRAVWADLRRELAKFVTLVPQDGEDAKETEIEYGARPPSERFPRDPSQATAPLARAKSARPPRTPEEIEDWLRALSRQAERTIDEFERLERNRTAQAAQDTRKAAEAEERAAELLSRIEGFGQWAQDTHLELHGNPKADPPVPSLFEQVSGLEGRVPGLRRLVVGLVLGSFLSGALSVFALCGFVLLWLTT